MNSKEALKLEDIGTDWVDRFWDKVSKGDENECWEWQACTSSGYGALKIKDNTYGSHRLSWLINNEKPIPKGSRRRA